MSEYRRASLPGADELFRSTASRQPVEAPPPLAKPPVDDRLMSELVEFAAEEDATQRSARDRLSGPAPSIATGSLLSWLAATARARHVVSVGAPAGVLGLWLLRGMEVSGLLTSITTDEADHRLGRAVFDEAGLTERVRSIAGGPDDVLPRLSDGGYDLVSWSAPVEHPREVRDHVLRLLRSGGVLVVVDVTSGGRDRLVRDLVDDPRCRVVVLPTDDGAALARRA